MQVEAMLQDGGKTLKVFITNKKGASIIMNERNLREVKWLKSI